MAAGTNDLQGALLALMCISLELKETAHIFSTELKKIPAHLSILNYPSWPVNTIIKLNRCSGK